MLYQRAGREEAERTVLSRDCPTPAMRAHEEDAERVWLWSTKKSIDDSKNMTSAA
jgi:hypothetical protein